MQPDIFIEIWKHSKKEGWFYNLFLEKRIFTKPKIIHEKT